MTGWHLSPSHNRASIAAAGLLTAEPGGWPDHGMVWLFVEQAVAEDASRRGTWGGSRGLDVWQVELGGLEVEPDPHPGWGKLRPGWDAAARVVRANIEPGRLSLAWSREGAAMTNA